MLYDLMSIYEDHGVDSPSFGPVIAELKSINRSVGEFVTTFADPASPSAADDATVSDSDASGDTVLGQPSSRAFAGGTPRSRADVEAAFAGILRFYAETEPSSPVPLMLRRVQTWIHKDFMELIQELAPNGADEVVRLLAIKSE